VVPLLAMLRARREAGAAVPALLLYSARNHEELICADEIEAMAAADAALRVVLVTTRAPARRAQDRDRRIDAGMLRELLGGWGELPQRVFVCGATPFVETIADGLRAAGVPAGAIRTERYGSSG